MYRHSGHGGYGERPYRSSSYGPGGSLRITTNYGQPRERSPPTQPRLAHRQNSRPTPPPASITKYGHTVVRRSPPRYPDPPPPPPPPAAPEVKAPRHFPDAKSARAAAAAEADKRNKLERELERILEERRDLNKLLQRERERQAEEEARWREQERERERQLRDRGKKYASPERDAPRPKRPRHSSPHDSRDRFDLVSRWHPKEDPKSVDPRVPSKEWKVTRVPVGNRGKAIVRRIAEFLRSRGALLTAGNFIGPQLTVVDFVRDAPPPTPPLDDITQALSPTLQHGKGLVVRSGTYIYYNPAAEDVSPTPTGSTTKKRVIKRAAAPGESQALPSGGSAKSETKPPQPVATLEAADPPPSASSVPADIQAQSPPVAPMPFVEEPYEDYEPPNEPDGDGNLQQLS